MDVPFPQQLGDFELVRELGRGGMGVVYEARQVSLNRRVALKVLSGGLGLTAKAVQRFRREAEAAARLHHTNIVPVYATGEAGGTHFYAMELVDGPSLDRVLRNLRQAKEPASNGKSTDVPHDLDATGPYIESAGSSEAAGLSSSSLNSGTAYFDTVARLVSEVADALEYAHLQGVIHRDIKPSNLLLAPSGRLSVNDFGLARMLEQPGMTMTGEFVGTPAYMSPEEITAGRTPLDHRTDIYSLGATLYELLTLQPPFRGERRDQILAQILHKEPKAPRKVNPKVPVDLETVCLKALEKDPDRRYQSAGKMAEDLRCYLNRFAISARRAGPVRRLTKWVRRRPALAATLTLAAFLAAATVFFAYQGYQTEQHLLAEKLAAQQQNALERALLVAMSGDLDAAEKAIEEAERLGVSTGQVRLLRGEVEYYRGNVSKAIPHLEQAVKLLPVAESAGARGLLVVAYVYAMRLDEAARELRELEPIQPVSVEDYLFKGSATSQFDEERGLEILDQAVKQRPSSAIARLFRSDTLANLAGIRAIPRIAARAIEDAETAKRLLADSSPVGIWYCEGAYILAAFVYQAAGQEEKYREAKRLALQEAEALEPYKHLPDAAVFRTYAYWNFGQKDHTLDDLRSLSQRVNSPLVSYSYTLLLCWRGSSADLQEARRGLQPFLHSPPLIMLNCLAVAELEGVEAAIKVYGQDNSQIAYSPFRVMIDSIPLLLGKPDLARAASRASRQRNLFFRANEQALWHAAMDYLAGDGTDADLLRAAANNHRQVSQASFYIGLKRLAEGDRAGARREFQKTIATSSPNTFAFDLCVILLARLEHDANWPPWIVNKK